MVDLPLMDALLAALKPGCRLVMVGDSRPAALRGPRQRAGGYPRRGAVASVALTEVFRQAKPSMIVENAHHINCGESLQKGGKRDTSFSSKRKESCPRRLIPWCDWSQSACPRYLGVDPVRDIQVMCADKALGPGAQALNVELQKALNPQQRKNPSCRRGQGVPRGRQGDAGQQQLRDRLEARIGGEQGVGATTATLASPTPPTQGRNHRGAWTMAARPCTRWPTTKNWRLPTP